jgi:pyruvate dehydrogenase E1 component beta subunit
MARLTLREAITEALRDEMHRDEKVFIMGEEVADWGGTYAVTKGFLEEFGPERVRDTPISEMVIGGAATGAAMAGLRPVAEFMTINFAFLAFDAIVNHAAKVSYMFNGQFDCPVVFRAPGGGGKQLGATHSHTPDVIFAHFPGLKVVCPATPYDAKGLLNQPSVTMVRCCSLNLCRFTPRPGYAAKYRKRTTQCPLASQILNEKVRM